MQEFNEQPVRSQRWSAKRKLEVVRRLIQGEAIDAVSRDCGVEVHQLDEWYREALDSMEQGFKRRAVDPESRELARAKQQIGELSMVIELLRMRVAKAGPLALRRSKK